MREWMKEKGGNIMKKEKWKKEKDRDKKNGKWWEKNEEKKREKRRRWNSQNGNEGDGTPEAETKETELPKQEIVFPIKV